jgi:sialidase-1
MLLLVCLLGIAASAAAAKPLKIDLFTAGEGGYETYRIPGVVVTAKGSLIAYCEARRTARSDWGEIDILMRRSTDGGQTWSEPVKLGKLPADVKKNEVATAQKLGQPDKFTMNNPVAIAAPDGTVHFLYCIEYARCFYMQSRDDGATFSEPVEITKAFEPFRDEYAWKVLATGPGHGIALKSGRLVVPVWLSTGTGGHAHRPSAVSTIFSDDQGKTWQRGEIVAQHGEEILNPSETALVELSDGRVMANLRTESKVNRRLVSISADGATKWSAPKFDDALAEPICMASLVRVDSKHIAFSNPDNLLSGDKLGAPGKGRDRKNVTVRLSDDDGRTWKWSRVLAPGISGYSDLAADGHGAIYCFFENGGVNNKPGPTAALTLVRLTVEELKQ